MASITRRATATTLTDTPTMDEAKQPLSPTTPIGPASPAVFPPLAPPAVAAFIHPLDPSHHPLPTFRTYKRRFPGYILLLLLSLMVSYSFTAFAVVAPVVADYFSTSTTTVNWFATLWLFCNTLACPPACWAMRRGSKTALVIGAALMLVSSWLKFGGTRIRSLGLAMAGQMLSGFASAFVCNVPVLYSNEWFSPGTRAVATAVGCLANVAGGVLGSLVMPVWVEGVGDVEGSVLWTGVITTVVAVPVVFIPKLPPTAPSVAVGEVEKVSVREEIRWLVRSREAVVLTVAFMTASGLWNSMSALLLEVLLPYAYTAQQSGIANALLNSIGPIASLFLAALADRTKAHLGIARCCAVLLAIAVVVFIWVPASLNLAFLYVATSLLSIAILGVWPVVLELMTEIVYPRGCEVAVCAMFAGVSFAGGCFTIAMGYMKDKDDTLQPAVYLQTALGLTAALLYISLGMFGRSEYVRMKRCGVEKAFVGEGGHAMASITA